MAYRTDAGGLAIKCNDIKLHTSSSTWATRLSQLYRQAGIVRILTYSLPDMAYVKVQLGRRPKDIFIICHEKFQIRAREIKKAFPDIRIATHPELHSKILSIEPHTVYVSSANFGSSHWIESCIGLHSSEAHNFYKAMFENVWINSQEV